MNFEQDDTLDSLEERIHAVEHELIVKGINSVLAYLFDSPPRVNRIREMLSNPPLPKSAATEEYDPASPQHRGGENYSFSSEPQPVSKEGKKLFREASRNEEADGKTA